jgi:hypothetical protein
MLMIALLDPLNGDGYQFWSGIGSGSPIFIGVLLFWRHHNCAVHGCYRLGRHRVSGTEHVVCRRHHPDQAPSAQRVLDDHADAHRT